MPNVVIVGGGVIGCATAFYLAQAGAQVTVLERGEIGGEASGAAAGMLAALSSEGGERAPFFNALIDASLALYPKLLPDLKLTGIDVRHHRVGVLSLALNDDDAAALRLSYDARRAETNDLDWLEGAEIQKVEPQANPRAVAAMVSTQEEYVDPRRLTEALAAAGQARGVAIEAETEVTSLVRRGNETLRGVRAGGQMYAADAVLLAGGPWTAELAHRLGAVVPVRPVRGQMLSLDGPAEPLRHMVWGNHAYLVPREDGQTFVGATVEEAGFRKYNTKGGLRDLRSGAAGLVPALAKAPQRHAWAGLRPGSADGLPIMGLLPGWQNVWVSTGHFRNGILLAPASGEVVARSIMAGRPVEELAPFDPARFEA